ncbi:gamma-glutamyltranspeptidase / glutathione hydrolase [Geosmithia morbida]|uniref:Glutathione hydrolase n=1 Tax=Geosmithia morbida TaxID=1094350 RepID=A0A9P4YZP2_9HYPO|nr:gamma-glutamyltranspeptidase / glutathione hydrolase [Geosmithia morbida]KAF4125880.1 gamma-glutamyltranspeptidase / glutathione hydrolase [Geosmithia morbida]
MRAAHIFRTSLELILSLSLHHELAYAGAIPEVVFQPGYMTEGRKGGVASESIECSRIGRDLLARGGNAVDALVGTTFCVGVIGMYHSGIGGGGFVMVRDSKGNYEAIDFRESAPAAAWEGMYSGNVEGSMFGGLSVGVPSEVAGLEYTHRKYGSLPWEMVMHGAIHVARDGFRVSPDHIKYVNMTIKDKRNFLVEDPVWAQDFAPNGTLLEVGDIMTRRRYADTLEKIAKYGSEAFYTGEIAESMIKTIQDANGTMTLDDLKSYKVISRPVANTSYRGVQLHGMTAPASGSVCFNILKIMEQFPLEDRKDVNLTMHRYDEAMRFAYAARLEIGDPDFVPHMADLEADMLSEVNAKKIRDRIRDNQTLPVEEYNPKKIFAPEGHGTSHISTADASGMATALTTTVNLLFGAQIMDPVSGIILNDEMNDFSIPGVRNGFGFAPSPANFIRPHKRPLSSITPVIAARPDGSLLATVGAAGGSRIISSTAQVLWHTLEHNMSLADALRYPRLHDQLIPNLVLVENEMDRPIVDALEAKGHKIKWTAPIISAVQAVWRFADGVFDAVGEPRQLNSAGLTL